MFRTATMVWTDLLVDRDAITDTLDILGNLEIIELQKPTDAAGSFPVELELDDTLVKRITDLGRLLQPLAHYLPSPDPAGLNRKRRSQSTESILPELEMRLHKWLDTAQPLVERLQAAATNLQDLGLLAACLAAIPEQDIEIGDLARGATATEFPAFLAQGDAAESGSLALADAGGQLIKQVYPIRNGQGDEKVVVLGVCAAARLPELEKQLHRGHWRFARIPRDLQGSSVDALQQVEGRMRTVQQLTADLQQELQQLNQRCEIASERWLLQRHLWLNQVLAGARRGQRFVWFSGWVPASRLQELSNRLEADDIPFLLSSEPCTGHGTVPVQLRNPGPVRRFETFVRGFGVPDSNEVDPSPLLAITTPLMFGYMFGDIGHGLVLLAAGWLFKAKLPVLGLLMPAGLSSIMFGVLFGSVFCSEHILPALWLSPMQEPLLILAVPIGFGVAMMLLSLAFAAVQAAWQGRAAEWWNFRFPIIPVYLGLLWGLADRRGLIVAGCGMLWLLFAETFHAARISGASSVLTRPFKTAVETLEALLQMFINTLSFSRLGAFALAHAGLGMAIVILGSMSDTAVVRWAILLVGNLLVIALEGLVVSIQTTRLVMFEFFRRFLQGRGREFQPLRSPRHTAEQRLSVNLKQE